RKSSQSPKSRLRFFHSRQHTLGSERRFAQAHADGVEDCVGNRGGDRSAGGLAAAECGHLRPVDQDDLNFGNVWKSKDGVSAPIKGLDAGGIELDFFHKRAADTLNNIPLDLVL